MQPCHPTPGRHSCAAQQRLFGAPASHVLLCRPRRRRAMQAAVLSPRRAADEVPAACSSGSGGGGSDSGSSSGTAWHSEPQPSSLNVPAEMLPRHLAVIMDGNSRWASARGLPAAVGYQQGVEALRTVVRCCRRWGVPCLTVYAFSAENWRREAAEVDFLLGLLERVLAAEVAELAARGVRLRFIGELGMLPRSLQQQISRAELATADNCDLHLTVALSYSGRQDLTAAVQEIARLAAAGHLHPGQVTPELIARHLATRQLPPDWREPDLIVRTSGERRLSNFLIWEAAYSELYFSDVMWPDFGERQLAEALQDFARRERRYGGRQHSSGCSSGSGGDHGISNSTSSNGSSSSRSSNSSQ